jgi:acyl-coenzyme A thioesterase PaaI-like protein
MTVETRFDELARSWEARPLLRELGITVREIEPGRALLSMERNGTNVSGIRDSINGGVQVTYAELAAHIARHATR